MTNEQRIRQQCLEMALRDRGDARMVIMNAERIYQYLMDGEMRWLDPKPEPVAKAKGGAGE